MQRLIRQMLGRFPVGDVVEDGRAWRRIHFSSPCVPENVTSQHDGDLDPSVAVLLVAVCSRRMLVMNHIMIEGTEIAHVERPGFLAQADTAVFPTLDVHPTGAKQS